MILEEFGQCSQFLDPSPCSFKFNSIKDILNEEQKQASPGYIPPSFKGMILLGVLKKGKLLNTQTQQQKMKRTLAKWRVNSRQTYVKECLNKFLTFGPIKEQTFFYRLKALTYKGRKRVNRSIEHNFEFLQNQVTQFIDNKNADYPISRIQLTSQHAIRHHGLVIDASLTDFLKSTLVLNENQQTSSDHIEYRNNILQFSEEQRTKIKLKKINEKLYRFLQFLEIKKVKLLQHCFFKIKLDGIEENYEVELLRARRNLQLAQNSVVLQHRLQKFDDDQENELQNLQKLTGEINYLKQKFLLFKVKDLIKCLKQHSYPRLKHAFEELKEQFTKDIDKSQHIYQIQEMSGQSSTSLTNLPSICQIQSLTNTKSKKYIKSFGNCGELDGCLE